MADEKPNQLEFDVVVRSFAEAVESLANVRDQLRVLTDLRETEEKAEASLRDAAGQVARFAAEAATILKGLEDAQTTVAEVLKSGADLLDGTELKGIAETVNAHSLSIASVDGRVDARDSKVADLIETVGALQTSMQLGVEGLKADLQNVHEDVKEPIVVKRLF